MCLRRHTPWVSLHTNSHTGGGTLDSTLTASKLFVCTSEPDIVCEIKQAVSDTLLQFQFSWGFNVCLSFIVSQNDSRMVVIKAPVQPAPVVHSFFVMVYRYVLLHGLYWYSTVVCDVSILYFVYKLWARNMLCMWMPWCEWSDLNTSSLPSILSKKYIVSPTEIWQIFIHSVHR